MSDGAKIIEGLEDAVGGIVSATYTIRKTIMFEITKTEFSDHGVGTKSIGLTDSMENATAMVNAMKDFDESK